MSHENEHASESNRWIVSPHVLVSWQGGRVEFYSGRTGAHLASENLDILQILCCFSSASTVDRAIDSLTEYDASEVENCILELIRAGILIRPETEAPAVDMWDARSLVFHRCSREPFMRAEAPPEPTGMRAPSALDTILLVRGDTSSARSFAEVLSARRSWRVWPPQRCIPFETFSQFLWLSARDRTMQPRDAVAETRPYPSGGGIYSLVLYAALSERAVGGLPGGFYRYSPDVHAMELLSRASDDYGSLLEAASRSAGSATPPIVFVITSRFARQARWYGKIAYSLVLKEVGCLFQTFYLVGEHLQLAPCALGGGMPTELVERLTGANETVEPIVGEFMIGPR